MGHEADDVEQTIRVEEEEVERFKDSLIIGGKRENGEADPQSLGDAVKVATTGRRIRELEENARLEGAAEERAERSRQKRCGPSAHARSAVARCLMSGKVVLPFSFQGRW